MGNGTPSFEASAWPIQAPPVPRDDWAVPVVMDEVALPAEQRRCLGDLWVQRGLEEHASIAEFSMLSNRLLAVAAPWTLVARAQRAAVESIHGTELCFGVARALTGVALGPGRLPENAAPGATTVKDLVTRSFSGGCVHFLVTAAEYRWASERAGDVAVQSHLDELARSHRARAELCWRLVSWALEGQPDASVGLLRAARQCFAESSDDEPESDRLSGVLPVPIDAWLVEYGGVPEACRLSLRREVLRYEFAERAAKLLEPLEPWVAREGDVHETG